jgi:hypothetical protein
MEKKILFKDFKDRISDSEQWGKGSWTKEPGEFVRIWAYYKGLPYTLGRNVLGVWLGYVAIRKDMLVYTNNFDWEQLEIHGGITYSDHAYPLMELPYEDNDQLYWIGFDCGHYGDKVPQRNYIRSILPRGMRKELKELEKKLLTKRVEKYRTLEFAIKQCKLLIDQISEEESKLC